MPNKSTPHPSRPSELQAEKELLRFNGQHTPAQGDAHQQSSPAVHSGHDHDHYHHDHSHDHGHDHAHDHDHETLSEMDVRVRAVESLLLEKGYVESSTLDALIDLYENKIGPRNGAHVVAKSWVDPDFKAWLLKDATSAIASLGYTGRLGEHITAVENRPGTHNVVVCTLCSCYPWPVLGLAPTWYKSTPYRSRVVIDPRGVLLEFGVELPSETEIIVWDSTSEMRYLVIPMRPEGTDGMTEEELTALVTRNSMIGTDDLARKN